MKRIKAQGIMFPICDTTLRKNGTVAMRFYKPFFDKERGEWILIDPDTNQDITQFEYSLKSVARQLRDVYSGKLKYVEINREKK